MCELDGSSLGSRESCFDLERVNTPVPPNTARGFGYGGVSDFAAIWYDNKEKLVYVCDGKRFWCGAGLVEWLRFVGHPLMHAELAPYRLAKPGENGGTLPALLLHIPNRVLYVGNLGNVFDALDNLAGAWPMSKMGFSMKQRAEIVPEMNKVIAWMNREYSSIKTRERAANRKTRRMAPVPRLRLF